MSLYHGFFKHSLTVKNVRLFLIYNTNSDLMNTFMCKAFPHFYFLRFPEMKSMDQNI